MKLNFEIDLATDSRESISMAANFLQQLTNAVRKPAQIFPVVASTGNSQPAVEQNTGNDGTGLSPSPGAVIVGVDSVVAGEIPEAKTESTSTVTDAPAEAKRRGRPRKEVTGMPVGKSEPQSPASTEDSAPKVESSSTSTDAETAPTKSEPLTLDDVRAALQEFTGAKGVPAGIELLREFGAARVSELPADRYAEFVGQCK